MKIITHSLALTFLLLSAISATAATPREPDLNLEKKIAYQQGQFGGLYAHCGTDDQKKAVLGGTLTDWRSDTFRGFTGSLGERQALEASFDEAATAVAADTTSCDNWIKQAAATWRSISYLATAPMPAAIKK